MRICARWASSLLILLAGCVPPRESDGPPADAGFRILEEGSVPGAGEETLPADLDARAFIHRLIDARSRGKRVACPALPSEALDWLRTNGESLSGIKPVEPSSHGRWRFTQKADTVYALWLRMDDELFLPATLTIPTAKFQPRPGSAPRLLGQVRGITGFTRDFVEGQLVCELSPELALRASREPALVLAIELDLR